MCQMVWHEMKSSLQPAPEKLLGNAVHLTEPQPEGLLKPLIPPLGAVLRPARLWLERIGHVIDIAGGKPGMIQAEADRPLGELMRVVEFHHLTVFDAIEPFL